MIRSKARSDTQGCLWDSLRRVVLLLCLLWSAPGHAQEPPALRFVYMENYAPFCFRENGKIVGIQPEIVDYLASQLNLRVEHALHPWNRSQAMVQWGEADAMLTTPTAERFAYALFAREETTPNFWHLFYRKNDARMASLVGSFRGLEDLKPYRLIDFLGNGWTARFMSEAQGFTNITFIDDPSRLPLLLVRGRGDLVLSSSALMNYHAKKAGLRDQLRERDLDWPFTRFHQVIQVSRKSPWAKTGLIKALDQATRQMKKDGVYQRILLKYQSPAGSGAPFESDLDAAWLAAQGFYAHYDDLPEPTGHWSVVPDALDR